MKTILQIFSAFLILNLLACSGGNEQEKNIGNMVTVISVESWLNLMPGGKGSFHITGYIKVDSTFKEDIFLELIEISHNTSLVYSFIPQTMEIIDSELIEKSENFITQQFFNSDGLTIKDEIKNAEKINVRLIFKYKEKEIAKEINNVNLDKVY